MSTGTETPAVEMLEQAVYKVTCAKRDVEKLTEDRDRKKRAANKARELEEAAPLLRKNAEARYLLLKNRLDSVEAETTEAGRTEAADTILSTIQHWQATARNVHHKLKGYADNLDLGKISANVRTEAEKVQQESAHVETELAALEADEKKIDNAVKGFHESTLPAKRTGSQEYTGQQGQQKPPAKGRRKPAAGSGAYDPKKEREELQQAVGMAHEELEAARIAEELAPTAARSKQADLQAAEKMLQARAEWLAAAEAELSRIQQHYFVTRIVMGRPNAEGWAVGKAYFKNEIPPDYRLSWKAGNADIEPMNPQGTEVRINVGMLPVGTTMARVTIEEIPKDVVIEEDIVVVEEDAAATERPDDIAGQKDASAPET